MITRHWFDVCRSVEYVFWLDGTLMQSSPARQEYQGADPNGEVMLFASIDRMDIGIAATAGYT